MTSLINYISKNHIYEQNGGNPAQVQHQDLMITDSIRTRQEISESSCRILPIQIYQIPV